ncbi:flippase [Natrialba sp. PRR66]|uniref:flippase n=1 Tax=Natrialba sp. PRR66 TaxID=3098146 RepID=UPI002B1D6A6D|nr:flippase [Natrialba sp. PRR66]
MPDESTSSLRTVTRGAGLFIAGRGISNILRFFINLLLTRSLGTSLYGIYSFGNITLSISLIFTNLGTDRSILKFIPQFDGERKHQNQILGLAALTSTGASIVVAVGLYFAAPWITAMTLNRPLETDVIQYFALLLPVSTLTNSIVSLFRSLELPKYHVLISQIVVPLTRLVSVGIAFVIGLSLLGTVAAIVVGSVIAFLIAIRLFLLKTKLRPRRGSSREMAVEFYDFSIPLTLSKAGSFLANRVDVLMVGIFLTSSAVGIYNVATLIAGLLTLPLAGFNQLFPSIASQLYSERKLNELESIYCRVTRWTFTIALLMAIGAIVFRMEILTLFGEDFVAGHVVLVLFVFGQLTNATVGPSGYLLMMTDHQYVTLVNQWVLGVFNVGLNYILIQELGMIGAAVATASVLATVNLVRVGELWWLEGLFPYSHSFVKPLVAGVVAGVTMVMIRDLFSGLVSLFVGGGMGVLVFGVILVVLGIEQGDRELFDEVIS